MDSWICARPGAAGDAERIAQICLMEDLGGR
jgi:hypothetical protein